MVRKIFYHGVSMNPLLKRGDTLLVAPYGSQEIHPGDIVLFLDPLRGQVVHRVVAVSAGGVTTRGDNNPNIDDRVLAPDEILGWVTAIERQGRTLPVPRKAPATLYLLKARRWCDRATSWLLKPVYYHVAQSGLFQRCLAPWMQPRLIYFSHPEGSEWQLWLGSCLIGRKKPNKSQWEIRRPFRLFVDEASLPHQPPESPPLTP